MDVVQGTTLEDEAARLVAVRRYDVLDTPPDGAFDRITSLAARVCRVPISTITIVDEDRIWFKSAVGLDGVDQIDREPGLCASAILHPDPYVITDAAVDPRSLSNSLVRGDLGLRFYVGIPLTTSDGYRLGTLNVIDRTPRSVSVDEVESLQDLAAIVVDELELRLAARRSVELESLRAAAAFRDTIVAGLSHEVRTPVAVLQGIGGLLEDRPLDEADRERVGGVLRRQTRHLGRLVEQFLDYSRLEHGEVPTVTLTSTDLGDLLVDVVDLHADRGRVDLVVEGEVPPALVDTDRTHRIVSELVTNALRFGPAGGPVTVTLTAGRRRTVRVAVADRGPGVAPAARPHLFERYYRSPGSTGSGIGLFVAQALATAQGGAIEVADAPGGGACFTLVLGASGAP